ncbi:MAG: MFS transporter [Clostridiales bacterium]|nr:MFS transporter [Clostridiales bacterium]
MKNKHYAWAILAACCALSLSIGLTANCQGQYFVPVTRDLGFGMGEFTLYGSIRGVFMVFSMFQLSKVLEKVNFRLLISGCFAATMMITALMGAFNHIWQWYAAGAVLGIISPMVGLVMPPIILSNWFIKRRGFAVGLAMTFSGIGGAVMNPVIARIIELYGWRFAYVANALIASVIILPFLIFVIDLKPSDRGLKPYGYEEDTEKGDVPGAAGAPAQVKGVSREDAVRSFSFIPTIIVAAIIGYFAAYSHLLAAYGASIGLAATMAAYLSSLSMIGNVTIKVALGLINDKFGGMKMIYFNLGLTLASLALLRFGAGYMPLLFAGAFLAGNFLTISSVAAPLLVHTVYGSRDYTRIFLLFSVSMNLIMSFGQPIIGFTYDKTGSYALSHNLGMILVVVTVALTHLAYRTSRKLTWS